MVSRLQGAFECGQVAVPVASENAANRHHEEQPGCEGRIPVGPEVRGAELERETGVDQDCEESDEAQDDMDIQPGARVCS